MTLNSFCFIRNTFYDLNPTLTYQDVVDILYSSIKYSIKPIIKQCNSFLLKIDNLNDYWIVIKSFSGHSRVLFESFFNKFTSKCEFFSNNIDEIVSNVKFITYSSLFEVEIICQYILSEELIDHQSCYEIITKWCRWQYNNKFKPLLLIKNDDDGEISTFTIDHEQEILQKEFDALNESNATLNTSLMSSYQPNDDDNNEYKTNINNHMINKWQDLFDDFIGMIDFVKMDLEFLLTQIRSDHIMTQQDLLSILLQKYEYDKKRDNDNCIKYNNYRYRDRTTSRSKYKLKKRKTIGPTTSLSLHSSSSSISPIKSNSHDNDNNNNNIRDKVFEKRVSTSSNLSNTSNLSGLSQLSGFSQISNGSNQSIQSFKSQDLFLNRDELDELRVGTKIDLRDDFGRYLKAEITKIDEFNDNKIYCHYQGWSRMWDKWIDLETNEYQFITRLGQITDREVNKQQLRDLVIGDKIICKLPPYHKHHGMGWINAEIINMDKGQLNVQYKLSDDDCDSENDFHEFWIHADNENECR